MLAQRRLPDLFRQAPVKLCHMTGFFILWRQPLDLLENARRQTLVDDVMRKCPQPKSTPP